MNITSSNSNINNLEIGILNNDEFDMKLIMSSITSDCSRVCQVDSDCCMKRAWRKIKGLWKTYSFWARNLVLIVSCLTTCICIGVEMNKVLYDNELESGIDYIVVYTIIVFVFSISICGIITSISTMKMEYRSKDKENKIDKKKWYSSDRYFRGICVIKTVLFQVKQPLIWYFNSNYWSYIFRILSFMTLLTIAFLTYNSKFRKLISLSVIKYPRLLMYCYIFNYTITNIFCSILIIIGIIFAHIGSKNIIKIINGLIGLILFIYHFYGYMHQNYLIMRWRD